MSSFRETMTAAMGEAGGPPPGAPMGPPPGAMGSAASSEDSDEDEEEGASAASTSSGSQAAAGTPDLAAFLKQLASRYASLSEQGALAGSSVSETA